MGNFVVADIETEYSSYEGMSRTAMIWGIPFIPMVVTVVFSTVLAFLALQYFDFNLKAFAIWFLCIPVLAFMKIITKRDNQAMRVISIEMYWWMQRSNAALFGNTFTLTAVKFGRNKDDYLRFVKADSEKAEVAARLFAENRQTH